MRRSKATKTLARKLLAIRLWKDLSQREILKVVMPEAEAANRALVSQCENAKREPSRDALIRYRQLAGITFEELLIDEKDLPAQIQRFAYRYDGDIRKKRAQRKTISDSKVSMPESGDARGNGRLNESLAENKRCDSVSSDNVSNNFEFRSESQPLDSASDSVELAVHLDSSRSRDFDNSSSDLFDYSIKPTSVESRLAILDYYREEINSAFVESEKTDSINLIKSEDGSYYADYSSYSETAEQGEEQNLFNLLNNPSALTHFVNEQFARINEQATEAAEQSIRITEQQFVQQLKLSNQLTEQSAQMQEELQRLLEIYYDQQQIAAQNNASFLTTAQNSGFVNSSDLEEAKQREFWKKDRE